MRTPRLLAVAAAASLALLSACGTVGSGAEPTQQQEAKPVTQVNASPSKDIPAPTAPHTVPAIAMPRPVKRTWPV